jgi:hypothetical protein
VGRLIDGVTVRFEISGRLYGLEEGRATILAEELRRKAAGQLGEYGVEGAREVADAIEQVLVGASSAPIVLNEGETASAVFYLLDVGLDARDPRSDEA